jgi:hypothetical protein
MVWYSKILRKDVYSIIDDGNLRELSQIENKEDFCPVRLFIDCYYVKKQTTIIEFLTYQMYFDFNIVNFVNKLINKKVIRKSTTVPLNHPVLSAEEDYTNYWNETYGEETEEHFPQEFIKSHKYIDWMDVNLKLKTIQEKI